LLRRETRRELDLAGQRGRHGDDKCVAGEERAPAVCVHGGADALAAAGRARIDTEHARGELRAAL
jgi:hypothetical protein